ncbi:LysR substrate-binding domain-containing protein [Pseudoroseomonas globiformis]|uniref:LysR substrate-binding domain-containing protein n=1 Tax=Teichococcus globiformis TaxID=2307229 RepID=A0ABV7FY24_9PROT
MAYDLTDLRLLVMVAEQGGIAAAARAANLSVSALSERIKALESWTGTRLLLRGARGSQPTAAGLELAAHARAVLSGAARLEAAVAGWRGGEAGEVRLLVNSSALVSVLPDLLARFLARHPAAAVDLREALSDEVARALRHGEADLGIAAGTADLAGLATRSFREERLVLLVPAAHPFAARRRMAFAEAVDEAFISLDDGAAIHLFLVDQAARLGRVFRPRIRLRSFDGVGRMVAAGGGIAMVPAGTVTRAMRDAGARAVPLADAWARRQMVVCWPQERPLSPLAERLVAALAEAREEGRRRRPRQPG